jgi:integrase/recombinase XerC
MTGPAGRVPERFAGIYGGYARALKRAAAGLDAATRRAYDSRIRSYLTFLESAGTEDPDPLADPDGRDRAVRAYLGYLARTRRLAASTVNAHLTALDHFYAHLGLGPARVRRDQSPQRPPRTLDAEQQTRYQRAAGQWPLARDRAIFLLFLHSGVRPSELVALDVDDVRLSSGECLVIVPDGESRSIPLTDKPAQEAITQWVAERAGWPGASATTALFLNRFGDRLSTRAVRKLLAALACRAELTGQDGRPPASARTLRATFGANQLGGSPDALTVERLVTVAGQLGHRHLDTTLRLAGSSGSGPQ